MGASKDLWMADIDRLAEDYIAGNATDDDFIARMRGLGFTPDEARESLDALKDSLGMETE